MLSASKYEHGWTGNHLLRSETVSMAYVRLHAVSYIVFVTSCGVPGHRRLAQCGRQPV